MKLQVFRCSRKLLALYALSSAFLTLPVSIAAHADTYAFANSRLVIDLPAGFEASDMFSSVDNGATEQSFFVSEYPPADYDELAADLAQERLIANGAKSVSFLDLGGKGRHKLARVVQPTGEEDFVQYLYVLSADGFTQMVAAMAPQRRLDDGSVKEADILAALASIRPAPGFTDIFQLADSGPFRQNQLFGRRELFMLADRKTESTEISPVVLELAEVPEVASSGDLDKDARTAMTVATNLEPLAVNEVNAITISGLEGIEVVGTARIEEVETEVFVYQVYLRGKKGSYRLLLRAPAAEATALLPAVRKVAAGWSVHE